MFASRTLKNIVAYIELRLIAVLVLALTAIGPICDFNPVQALAQESSETNSTDTSSSTSQIGESNDQAKSETETAVEQEEDKPEEIFIGISIDTVPISSDFSGRSIAVFGTVDNADPFARLLNAYAIVVVVRGPDQEVVVRRKERMLGIWVNRKARSYGDVPSFYALASNQPLDVIASENVLREAGLGVNNIALSNYAGGGSPFVIPEPEFAESLLRIRQQDGLYSENPEGVDFLGSNLFRATLELPSSVPIGKHTVTAYLFRDGELLSSRSDSFEVRKVGFEDALYNLAHQHGFWYGVIAVIIALITGWLASVVFGRR
ncbi:MAG: TIGR02186 family protein [Rhizobiaceae bacterium]